MIIYLSFNLSGLNLNLLRKDGPLQVNRFKNRLEQVLLGILDLYFLDRLTDRFKHIENVSS